MLYDVHLELHYEYDSPAQGGRHLIRVTPITLPRVQRVVAASVLLDPKPSHKTIFFDFFGNSVLTAAYDNWHDALDVRLSARVAVEDTQPPADFSPTIDHLAEEISALWSVSANSPHHFLGPSPRVPLDNDIAGYASESVLRTRSVQAAAMDFCLAIHKDFTYEPGATDVGTSPSEAFALRKGVCQDFAHVMIAGLRGVGIPAGYVSGFIRTSPPPGKPRLEGSDAMHAWVRVWCGQQGGWIEFDPTNAMIAGPDHITIGHGRDYSDISPIVGVMKTSGSHEATQSVDVVRVE